jgi:hypothetical protein
MLGTHAPLVEHGTLTLDRVTTHHFGGFGVVNMHPHNMQVDRHASVAIEAFINSEWLPVVQKDYADYTPSFPMHRWGVPSIFIRLDMAPLQHNESSVGEKLYEVETNPAGFGIASIKNDTFTARCAELLQNLDIDTIGTATTLSREKGRVEHEYWLSLLADHGITIHGIDLANCASLDALPLWLRTGEEDYVLFKNCFDRCLLWHRHGGGDKRYLIPLTGAQRLIDCPNVFADPRFTDGFALKKRDGWGCIDLDVYCPHPPFHRCTTRTRMEKRVQALLDNGDAVNYLIQPFSPPAILGVEKKKPWILIWRVFAGWTGTKYNVIGGKWLARKNSLKVHGADNTIMGTLDT